MRFALFSDVHSNLQALKAVLRDMRRQSVDHMICLGDIVGYNASPSECLQLVRESGADTLLGNHDFFASNNAELDWYNPVARAGLEYSRQVLTKADKKWLAELPVALNYGGFSVVHSSLADPENWPYVTTAQAAEESFAFQEEPLCFIGHTHQVRIHRFDGRKTRSVRVPETLTLKKGVKYLINVGSVGQPRDGRTTSAYVIYDKEAGKVEFHRVTYPILQAADEILNAGLPQYLAYRLTKGI